ncbi:ATP-binding protein [Aneurinibacillus tyrosinisolvens]|uniref:ATP-binding protein n=1 Tax=Aneurinibacillus tyrosinisolvens TaxID=1443435 RepID=UPI00063F4F1E|nr:ATP-binding protein [Aneurinibacillus tyrosinisolvens]
MGKQLEWWSSRFEDTALNDERTGMRESGSGLGLAISQQIVQQHGGEIELNSTPHEGTTVTIRLPLLAWD